jgi:hypothetical protein
MAQAQTVPNSNHGTVHRLDCYRLAVEFHRLVAKPAPHGSGLGDQLRRAAASIALNLAEGHGRLLDLLSGDDESHPALIKARRLLVRVVQTTTGLWRKQAG